MLFVARSMSPEIKITGHVPPEQVTVMRDFSQPRLKRTMTRIVGTIIPGNRKALINYPLLIPRLVEHCPEIKGFGKDGTINIRLDQGVCKGNADCWTPRTWYSHTGEDSERPEAFGFIRIELEYPPDKRDSYSAWIIIPEGHSATYVADTIVEVMAAVRVPGLRYNSRCAVHIDHAPLIPRPAWFCKTARSYANMLSIAFFLKKVPGHPVCDDCFRIELKAANNHEIARITDWMKTEKGFLGRIDTCAQCGKSKPTIIGARQGEPAF
jgi:hypothetical protein